MSLSFDLYWSFRSPYSYLITERIVRLVADYDVDCRVRPVYPIAIRTPEFFEKVNPMWPPYLLRDTLRISQMEGIPYSWPQPDPVAQDIGRQRISEEQPHIHRLTRLGIAAVEAGRGLAFIDSVSRLIWSGKVNGWNEGDHLARAASEAGLDLAELDGLIEADPDHYEAVIHSNQEAHAAAGHWGVPTMVFEGDLFFGQDRFSHLLWRLEQHGLSKRPSH
ncbi:MAG: 2-hydroxychromene-2-carboxylate isomerase [bacterium]|nr:disulfide bond formation protein DsbA [Deltaproteobacteria bacterium]MCP4908890.1 2-hydroxychromene-2-carboxylate isomerase [bacterium]